MGKGTDRYIQKYLLRIMFYNSKGLSSTTLPQSLNFQITPHCKDFLFTFLLLTRPLGSQLLRLDCCSETGHPSNLVSDGFQVTHYTPFLTDNLLWT